MRRHLYRLTIGLCLVIMMMVTMVHSQEGVPLSTRVQPKIFPIAETKIIMEGMTANNYQSMEKILQKKPEDAEAWSFARGQALLIAESGNLLLLRPPKSDGVVDWNRTSLELRENAAVLAKSLADHDYMKSREQFIALAQTCNKCHHKFRIETRVTPFADPNKLGPQ